MVISVRYDETQLSWQVQWRCCGKKSTRVRDSACNSDKTMSGRVARELQGRIEGASDQSAKNAFMKLQEQIIEDALAGAAPAEFVQSAPATPGAGDPPLTLSMAPAGDALGGDGKRRRLDVPQVLDYVITTKPKWLAKTLSCNKSW